ncbi:GTPase HflX [Amaricoccus tamworthensis]|uniref:GTPase HflX n=1 Tax=Amaricoccus tamworthensis TaxID=57002 RepID=UPI003C7A34BF
MRTVVLHPARLNGSERDPSDALEEAVSLAAALDLEVVASDAVPLPKARAGTLFGSGKLEELAELVSSNEAGLVVVDAVVTPVQQRNLEKAWNCKVLDRTGLILEIFGDRAKTREGVLQVELAHLSYQKSRLVRSWTHLERQRGGVGFLGGPGETQIEADRRALDERMVRIRKSLDKVIRTRGQHRSARKRVPFPVVALVGYTNAGKSTLFNRLTGETVLARDMLFATLDPTMRSITLPSGRQVILSDTVGFISDLPTQLVAAFRATLEEVLEADLIVHVRDITHAETAHQAQNVHEVLEQLGLDEERQSGTLEVWNKVDKLTGEDLDATLNSAARGGDTLAISAVSGMGVDALLERIEQELASEMVEDQVELEFSDGKRRSWLFDRNVVLSEKVQEGGYLFDVRWSQRDRERFQKL